MDELHLEGELYLGYASFAYYVKTIHGFNLYRSGDYHLTLTGEGVCFYFKLTLDVPHAECGYVYVNSKDWGKLFGTDFELARELSEKCWRLKVSKLPTGIKDWHCNIDDNLKGNIKVIPDFGDDIICLHPPLTSII